MSGLAAGRAALAHGKLILLLALTSALLGALGAAPLNPSLEGALGRTLAGQHFIQNHPTFAPTDFFDFLIEHADAIRSTRRTAGAVGLLGVLLQAFFAGGIVAVLGRGPFTFGQFIEPARRNFGHNAKCLAIFVGACAAVQGVWLGAGLALRRRLLEGVPPDAASRTASGWVLAAGALLLFAALALLYDFARAARRYAPAIGAWRGWGFARRALAASWARALALYFFWLLAGGAVVLSAVSLAWGMTAVSLPAVWLLFAVQLAALWLRSALRIAAWGSYVGLLDARVRPAPAAIAS